MDKLMVFFLALIVACFLLAMVLDDTLIAVVGVGYSIIWSAFHLGDKMDSEE